MCKNLCKHPNKKQKQLLRKKNKKIGQKYAKKLVKIDTKNYVNKCKLREKYFKISDEKFIKQKLSKKQF